MIHAILIYSQIQISKKTIFRNSNSINNSGRIRSHNSVIQLDEKIKRTKHTRTKWKDKIKLLYIYIHSFPEKLKLWWITCIIQRLFSHSSCNQVICIIHWACFQKTVPPPPPRNYYHFLSRPKNSQIRYGRIIYQGKSVQLSGLGAYLINRIISTN